MLMFRAFMVNEKAIAYTKLLVVILIWGSVYHVAKFLVDGTDIYTVAFVRFFIASFVLLLLYYKKNKTLKLNCSRRQLLILSYIGFVGVFSYNILFLKAETLISANNVAILYAVTPCLIVLLGVIFLKNSLGAGGYVGIIVALLGTVGVIGLSDPSCKGSYLCPNLLTNLSFGQIIGLGASLAMAVYSVLNKKATHMNLDPLLISTFSILFGTVYLSVTFFIFGDALVLLLNKPWTFWCAMFYISVFGTVISYKWYIDAIHSFGVGKAGVFLNGVPLSAILIGVLVLGQPLSIGMTTFGLIVITGVIITNYSNYNKSISMVD